jgi:hypothetical protein
LTPGGSSTSHIYTQTVHIIQRKENNTEKGKIEKFGPCPVFGNYTLAFALQMRKNGVKDKAHYRVKFHVQPSIKISTQKT